MRTPLRRPLLQRFVPALSLVAIAVMAACSETPSVAPSQPLRPSGTIGSMAMVNCGASFRLISTEQDSLMTQYGIPNTVDTVDVCEAWTGSDYSYQATAVGSSDNVPGFVDSVQTVTYQGGSVTGYTESANAAAPASPVGSTAFDMLFADSSTRLASLDYPYYGVSSPGVVSTDPRLCRPLVICLDSTPRDSILASRSTMAANSALVPSASRNVAPPRFAKHGLLRHGLRALVDDADEIAPSKEGYRRFRAVHGKETIVRSIDPNTQLLVAEESDGPSDTTFTNHVWAHTAGGYVRDHSDLETIETVNGKKLRNHTRIVFQKVRISDPAFPALSTPVSTP